VRSVDCTLLSSLIRAAWKTISTWKQGHVEIMKEAARDESQVFLQDCVRGKPWHPCWNNDSVVFILRRAAAGQIENVTRKQKALASKLPCMIKEVLAEEKVFALQWPRRKFRFQRELYAKIFPIMHPDKLASTFLRRFLRLFPELAGEVNLDLMLCLKDFSLSLPAAFSQQLIRTWANGWCTSSRLHEATVLPCIFGCVGSPDALAHYCRCPVLWRVVSSCDRLSAAPSVPEVLCLASRVPSSALRLVVACNSYHALRRNSSLGIVSLLRAGNVREIERIAREVVRQQFISALSRPDVGHLFPDMWVGKHVLPPASFDLGVCSDVPLQFPVQALEALLPGVFLAIADGGAVDSGGA